MRLTATNGNVFEFGIDGYQFPGMTASGRYDHDPNWLMMKGRVVNGDRSWSFLDPCLTTWEAAELAGWLRSVAEGKLKPKPVDEDKEGGDLLVFTEPNVAFNLHDRTQAGAVIRVFLSLEALPANVEEDIFEYFVELPLGTGDVARAVTEWEAEMRQFPVKA